MSPLEDVIQVGCLGDDDSEQEDQEGEHLTVRYVRRTLFVHIPQNGHITAGAQS